MVKVTSAYKPSYPSDQCLSPSFGSITGPAVIVFLMFGFRKYPYLQHQGKFHLRPPTSLKCPFSEHKITSSPLWKLQEYYVHPHTLWKNSFWQGVLKLKYTPNARPSVLYVNPVELTSLNKGNNWRYALREHTANF